MRRFDKLLPIHEPIAARLNVRHFCDASCVSRLQKYAASTKKRDYGASAKNGKARVDSAANIVMAGRYALDRS
jgi:hypothetical protein